MKIEKNRRMKRKRKAGEKRRGRDEWGREDRHIERKRQMA